MSQTVILNQVMNQLNIYKKLNNLKKLKEEILGEIYIICKELECVIHL